MENTKLVAEAELRNRLKAILTATRSKDNLARCDVPEMREQIVETAQATGYYWSTWMTIFEDDEDMVQRLMNAMRQESRAK